MLKMRGILGGGHANQVILPNGPYGTLHVGAGGGGAPAEDSTNGNLNGPRDDAKGHA